MVDSAPCSRYSERALTGFQVDTIFGQYRRIFALTINKINFRSALVALALGSVVTAVPAFATTISLQSSSSPSTIAVGGYDISFNDPGGTQSLSLPASGGLTYAGGTMSTEIGAYSLAGDSGANATQSEVIDVNIKPTINGLQATTAVQFQASISETAGSYSLVFGNNGATACTNPGSSSCFATTNGNTINNGQQVITSGALSGDTILAVNGVDYAVQTRTTLTPGKSNYLNGFVGLVGVATAPEPATFATTGLAAAFLGLFLRRKIKQNS
jgi:hypothetical protein